ncbi:MAG: HAMP domain-containing protein, partial [Pseudomonadota bacterium]
MNNILKKYIYNLSLFQKIFFSLLFVGMVPVIIVGSIIILTSLINSLNISKINIIAITICFSLFISLFICGLLFPFIINPIKKLMLGIDRISNEDFNYKIEIKNSDEFGKLANAFNNMAIKLNKNIKQKENFMKLAHERAKLAAIGQTTQMLAHDVRKPFTSMKSLLNMLDKFKKDPKALEKAKIT